MNKAARCLLAVSAGVAAVCAGGLLAGCEVGSADAVVRDTLVDFTGFYDSTGTNTAFVSPANSGAPVTSLNLRQRGAELEAIDNHNIIFTGSLGDTDGSTVDFVLEGYTTVKSQVTIAGTLNGSGSSATMVGTWIESDRYCYLNGDAIINPIATNSPQPITNTNVVISLRMEYDPATVRQMAKASLWFMGEEFTRGLDS